MKIIFKSRLLKFNCFKILRGENFLDIIIIFIFNDDYRNINMKLLDVIRLGSWDGN